MQKYANACLYDNVNDIDNANVNVNVNDNVPCGAEKENKRKNYYQKKNNVPVLLRDDPSYDTEAFMRKALNLKYQKKEPQTDETNKDDQWPSL